MYGKISTTGGRTAAMVSGGLTTSKDDYLDLLRMICGQGQKFMVGKGSMDKTPMICSLLMAFGLSVAMVGCEPPKAGSGTKAPAKTGVGSSNGGGTEVPAASKGAAEKPKAPVAPAVDAKKPEEAPKVEAPKVEEPKVEAPKTEEPKPEAPKTEEPPKN